MELGLQTMQLLCTQKYSSSGFLNLTYCDAIINNVPGRQGSEFYLGIQTKGVRMGIASDSDKEIKIQIYMNYISDEQQNIFIGFWTRCPVRV